MSEHRGLWTALGVALVPLGPAGIVAYCVAALYATPQQPFRWSDPISLICIACTAIGIAILVVVTWSIRSRRGRVRKLALFVAAGNALLAKVRNERDNTKTEALEKEASNWATEVHAWLEQNLEEFAPHFLNEAGHGVQFSVSGREGLSNIGNGVDRRMHRLAEINLKAG